MHEISSRGAFPNYAVFPQKLQRFGHVRESQEFPHHLSQGLERDWVPALVLQHCRTKSALLMLHTDPLSSLQFMGAVVK